MKKYRFKVGDIFHFKNKYWDIIGIINKIYGSPPNLKFGFKYLQCNKRIDDKERFYLGSPVYRDSKIFKNKEEAFLEML